MHDDATGGTPAHHRTANVLTGAARARKYFPLRLAGLSMAWMAAASAGVPALPHSAPPANEAVTKPSSRPLSTVDDKILTGTNLKYADGHARFVISVEGFSLFEKMKINFAPLVGVVFNGAANDPGRTCPVFDLKSHPYTIREIRHDVFMIDAQASPAEMETVREKGCALMPPPDRHKIQFLKK